VAGLLSLFLGSLGIANFYLGRTNRGIAQIIVTILSLGTISTVWGIVEGILIFTAAPGTRWALDGEGRPLAD
jgi:TM2 domain-containing membrane protein YozV